MVVSRGFGERSLIASFASLRSRFETVQLKGLQSEFTAYLSDSRRFLCIRRIVSVSGYKGRMQWQSIWLTLRFGSMMAGATPPAFSSTISLWSGAGPTPGSNLLDQLQHRRGGYRLGREKQGENAVGGHGRGLTECPLT